MLIHFNKIALLKEKKYYLLNIARTLMVYMYVLKCFWADAALIAYRLINMVLSFVLNNKTSFSVLYPEKQLFDLPQKVFEYTCFVQILEKRHHKLDPRANQCVFLEYFFGHKKDINVEISSAEKVCDLCGCHFL